MNFLGWFSSPKASRDPSDDFWYKPVDRAAESGEIVTLEAALQLPVAYNCLRIFSEQVGSLPCALFERQVDSSKRKAIEHPLYDVINRKPNSQTSAYEFWGQCAFDLQSSGNFFAEILPGQRGPVDRLVRIEPSIVRVERLTDGGVRYEVRDLGKPPRFLLESEVFHLKMFPHIEHGLLGMSPIVAGKQAIGAALALQKYSSRFFKNDATPPFVIKHPGNFKDGKDRSNFLRALKRWWGGKRQHSPGVLEWGMEVEKVGTTNEEAQFLETKKEHALDLTRIWNMQPHKVGILDRATFSNIEQQSLEFVTDVLMPVLTCIEQGIACQLLLQPDRFFAEFNVASLLRGDLLSRYSAYAIGRNWGWLSVNDIRRKENENPVEDGDEYLRPLNMTPAGEELPEPPATPGQRNPKSGLVGPANAVNGAVHAPSV